MSSAQEGLTSAPTGPEPTGMPGDHQDVLEQQLVDQLLANGVLRAEAYAAAGRAPGAPGPDDGVEAGRRP